MGSATVKSPQVGGHFEIDRGAAHELAELSRKEMVLLRRALWDAIRSGSKPRLSRPVRDFPGTTHQPSLDRKILDMISCILRHTERFGRQAPLISPSIGPAELELMTILCIDYDFDDAFISEDYILEEMIFYLDYVVKKGYVERCDESGAYLFKGKITPEGLIFLEERSAAVAAHSQAFVAMWFAEDMDNVYQSGIEPAITAAGYKAHRIDRHEHINRVDDEILAQIRQSRFLVADFTSEPGRPRGGVYFEAGFALGLNIPVIWCARKEMESEIHFDIRQYNTIFWGSPGDLKERLYNRIVALIGVGPHATKPLRSVDREH
jgi:hypothetical protein